VAGGVVLVVRRTRKMRAQCGAHDKGFFQLNQIDGEQEGSGWEMGNAGWGMRIFNRSVWFSPPISVVRIVLDSFGALGGSNLILISSASLRLCG
jgi:hypothetical protein